MDRDRRECHLFWRSDRLKTGFREVEEVVGVDRDRKVCHLSWRFGKFQCQDRCW